MSENAKSGLLWCCHVRGPDDIHPAPDYETALKWADVTNALNWRGDHKPVDYADCLLKAVPALWSGSAELHAQELPKSIREFTPRNELPPSDPDYKPAAPLFPAPTLEAEPCSPQALMCDP